MEANKLFVDFRKNLINIQQVEDSFYYHQVFKVRDLAEISQLLLHP